MVKWLTKMELVRTEPIELVRTDSIGTRAHRGRVRMAPTCFCHSNTI
jgi:hypothetical protein